MNITQHKLYTRKKIIEAWNRQPDYFLNSPCCPHCRDILFKTTENIFVCENNHCDIFEIYLEK